MRRHLALGAALALAACGPRAPALVAKPHYVVGTPYEAGGRWFYPQESFGYRATGLAVRMPDRSGLTADGEVFDAGAMAGAHPTLQLPAIARVTNLRSGQQIRIRLNDRGPANPARLVGLTSQAAALIGLAPGDSVPVAIEVESGPSQALRDRLQGGPKGVTAAPVAAVQEESLPPPDGRSAGSGRVAPSPVRQSEAAPGPTEVPDSLPATVVQVPSAPAQLWIWAGKFSQSRYANAVKSSLSGISADVRRDGDGRDPAYVVMAGPFPSVAAADAALDQARAAGVTDAVIVVE